MESRYIVDVKHYSDSTISLLQAIGYTLERL